MALRAQRVADESGPRLDEALRPRESLWSARDVALVVKASGDAVPQELDPVPWRGLRRCRAPIGPVLVLIFTIFEIFTQKLTHRLTPQRPLSRPYWPLVGVNVDNFRNIYAKNGPLL